MPEKYPSKLSTLSAGISPPELRRNTSCLSLCTRVSQQGPAAPLGDHGAVLRGPRAEAYTTVNSSAVILQKPIDEQGTTSVESLWRETTNHETPLLCTKAKLVDHLLHHTLYMQPTPTL